MVVLSVPYGTRDGTPCARNVGRAKRAFGLREAERPNGFEAPQDRAQRPGVKGWGEGVACASADMAFRRALIRTVSWPLQEIRELLAGVGELKQDTMAKALQVGE